MNVVTDGFVAGRIREYLERPKKDLNQVVLAEMLNAFRRATIRQLMAEREDRKGYESNSLYSGPCARKSRLTFDGVEGEPLQARTVLKFLLGDLVELCVLGVAKLAGVSIGANNVDLSVTGMDGRKIPVHPDGLLMVPDESPLNLEVKSCDSKTFDRWQEQGGPGDQWGYETQASNEIAAWREAGFPVTRTCFVAVSTGSRQGSVAEFILPYDQAKVDGWHARRELRQAKELPMVPFEAVPETEFQRGKTVKAEHLAYGEPIWRNDRNGKAYGYAWLTGRKKLPVNCAYCAYKQRCWPDVQMEIQDGQPVWIVVR